MHRLTVLLEKKSKNLRSASLAAEQAALRIKAVGVRLKELRSDEEFQHVLTKAVSLSEPESEPSAKRQKTISSRLSTDIFVHSKAPMGATHLDLDHEDQYRRLYFEAVDEVTKAFNKRFGFE